jgi:hypothetical protein
MTSKWDIEHGQWMAEYREQEESEASPASTCSAWVLGELESLRNGIMQAHMKGAEYGDQVLMACMRAHHEAANQAIEKLGGEVVPLANLEALTQNPTGQEREASADPNC